MELPSRIARHSDNAGTFFDEMVIRYNAHEALVDALVRLVGLFQDHKGLRESYAIQLAQEALKALEGEGK